MQNSKPYKDLFDITMPNNRSDVCLIPKKTKNKDSSKYSSEIQELLEQYKKLSDNIKRIRGKLYTHGIDPENLK